MRTLPPVALLCLLAACSIETAPSGRPPGPPTAADSLARLEEDSAAHVQVMAALRQYYQRYSARNWRAVRSSFWPGATVAFRQAPPGERSVRVVVSSLDDFIRRQGTEAPAVFGAAPVHWHVQSYGDLADAWVIARARSGSTRERVDTTLGVNVFHLVRHDGQWRIAGLALAGELPGRPLVTPTDTARPRRPRR